MNRLLATLATLALLVGGCTSGSTASPLDASPAASPPPDSGLVGPSPGSTPSVVVPTSSATVPTPSAVATTPSPSASPASPSASHPTPAPTPAPTPTRTPAPTPGPTAAPTPPVTTGRSLYVTAGSRSSKLVALTFDFGGRIGDALAIVRYLAAQEVHATIFSTGDQADLAATNATVRDVFGVVCSTSNGLTLGNHSMTHADFATLTPAQMRGELADAAAALARVCPRESPLPFFRPPNGSLGGWQTAKFYEILDTVGGAGYSRTTTWDVDTLDWGAPGTTYHRTAAQIVANVEANATGGSIVLMHLGGYDTYAAIQVLVPWLRSHGYRLVDLHELLGV